MLNLSKTGNGRIQRVIDVDHSKLDLNLKFVPNWNHIGNIRQSVGALTDSVIPDADSVAAVSMVSAELLENAFKHGSKDTFVDYEVNVQEEITVITAANSWSADTEKNLSNLLATIEWIDTFDTPLDAYIERMKMIYEAENSESSGLGLVRIVYEGQCKLSCDIDKESQRVRVTARFLPREA